MGAHHVAVRETIELAHSLMPSERDYWRALHKATSQLGHGILISQFAAMKLNDVSRDYHSMNMFMASDTLGYDAAMKVFELALKSTKHLDEFE